MGNCGQPWATVGNRGQLFTDHSIVVCTDYNSIVQTSLRRGSLNAVYPREAWEVGTQTEHSDWELGEGDPARHKYHQTRGLRAGM